MYLRKFFVENAVAISLAAAKFPRFRMLVGRLKRAWRCGVFGSRRSLGQKQAVLIVRGGDLICSIRQIFTGLSVALRDWDDE
jgi:hypothetical protein